MTSSRVFATSASEPRSSFKIVGGLARVKPVPFTSQPLRSKLLATCLPSRPVAPVMRAVLAMVRGVGDVDSSAQDRSWAKSTASAMT